MYVGRTVYWIPVWGMFYIKWKPSQVYFLHYLPLSQKYSVHSFTAKPWGRPLHPSWVGRGARGAGSGEPACGEPWGTPSLRCLADEVTSFPSLLLHGMKGERRLKCMRSGKGQAGLGRGWNDSIVMWGPDHLQLSPGGQQGDCPPPSVPRAPRS